MLDTDFDVSNHTRFDGYPWWPSTQKGTGAILAAECLFVLYRDKRTSLWIFKVKREFTEFAGNVGAGWGPKGSFAP